jgi:lysophospholipid hydrolase
MVWYDAQQVETLTKKKRTKTVMPVRDTELAKIPDGVLHLIKLKFPIVTIRLLDFLGNRVAKSKEEMKGVFENN